MKSALPIRQRLSALTCLKSGPKAVLMEVCELHENGGRGCFISNPKLAEKLGISLATATRMVTLLGRLGLLVSDVVKAEANRRYLVPTAAVRACYAGGSEAEQLAAVAKLTIVKNAPAEELTIVKNDADYSQNGQLTIVKNDVDYSQNASRVIGDDQYDQLDDQHDQRVRGLREALAEVESELADAQKKIAQLETQLQAEREASRTRGAAGGQWKYDPADIAGNLVLPFDTDSFREMWAAYRRFREEDGQRRLTGGIQEQEALRHLGNLAAGSEATAREIIQYTIRGGYKSICKQDAKRTPTPTAPGQSGAGAKPTGTAADVAEAVTRRRFQRDSGRVDVQVQGAYTGQGPTGTAGVGPH